MKKFISLLLIFIIILSTMSLCFASKTFDYEAWKAEQNSADASSAPLLSSYDTDDGTKLDCDTAIYIANLETDTYLIVADKIFISACILGGSFIVGCIFIMVGLKNKK